jgi:hypothetical protein
LSFEKEWSFPALASYGVDGAPVSHFGVVEGWIFLFPRVPTALASYDYDASGWFAFGSSAGDLAHGVVEGQAEDLDVEVDGVAG